MITTLQIFCCLYLEKEGYHVTIASDGGKGIEEFRKVKPSLVLLDLMLPVMDGWGVCRAIRQESDVPIIMLTAKGETTDKVSGLKLGADDYITKPFEMKEVLARIEAVMRRSGEEPAKSAKRLEFDKLVIDMDAFELLVDGKRVDTPPKEMDASFITWRRRPIVFIPETSFLMRFGVLIISEIPGQWMSTSNA